MTELEPYRPQDSSALGVWAHDARQAATVAVSLAKTSFVSTTFRGKPEEIAAAILTGQEIGLAPMSSLRSIDVIQGTPAMRAHAIRGLVQSRGHEVWVIESTPSKAVVAGRRKGSDHEQKVTWTLERAQRMGLTTKDNWKRMPEAMLVARATAEVCRLIASDVLLGMPYAVEELDDPGAVESDEPKKRTVKRRALTPVPVEEPEPMTAEEQAAEAATDQGDDTDPALVPFEPDVDPVEAS